MAFRVLTKPHHKTRSEASRDIVRQARRDLAAAVAGAKLSRTVALLAVESLADALAHASACRMRFEALKMIGKRRA